MNQPNVTSAEAKHAGVKRKNHHTSLAATLAVAAELSRRGYDAAFTIGNTPRIDLLCAVPDGKAFKIQVKGLSYKNAVEVQKEFFRAPLQDDLFLVVVVVPCGADANVQYFVLSHEEAKRAFSLMPQKKRDGTPYKDGHDGLNWGAIKDHENRWDKLPPITV